MLAIMSPHNTQTGADKGEAQSGPNDVSLSLVVQNLCTHVVQAPVPISTPSASNDSVAGSKRTMSVHLGAPQHSRMASSGPLPLGKGVLQNDDWWHYVSKEDMHDMDMLSLGTKYVQAPKVTPKAYKAAKDVPIVVDRMLQGWDYEYGDYEAVVASDKIQTHPEHEILLVSADDVRIDTVAHRHAEYNALPARASAHVHSAFDFYSADFPVVRYANESFGGALSLEERIRLHLDQARSHVLTRCSFSFSSRLS